jgi:uncharacterized protein (TIGR00369 family)
MTADAPLWEFPGGLDRLIGLRLTRADGARVEAEIAVTDELLQGHGIVHGGVYCAIIETTASVGASLRAGLDQRMVGISNRTNFRRATTSGTLTVVAEFAADDDPRQLWSAAIHDERGRLVADGQVHLMRLAKPEE